MQSLTAALIVSGGDPIDVDTVNRLITENLYVICADSGVLTCENLGLKADLIVGDFDSCDYRDIFGLKCAKACEIITLNPVKDDTDTEFAIDKALEKGYKKIYLLGGIGSRMDHTLANVFLMEKCYKAGARLVIINKNNVLHYVKNSRIDLKKSVYKYVSVIPLEDSLISNGGLKYSLDRELMHRDSSRGISNEFEKNEGFITVHKGSALVIESKG